MVPLRSSAADSGRDRGVDARSTRIRRPSTLLCRYADHEPNGHLRPAHMATHEPRGGAHLRRALARLVLGCGLIAATGARADDRMAFPGRDWEKATPESQGVDT